MYLLTLKDRRDDGAYAVLNRYGEKVLFMFEEEDDAERYAMMLNDDEDATLNVIEIEDALAIKTCKMDNYKLFDTREFKDKIVKVVVKKKTDQKQFEKFIDKLYNSGIQDLKIIENFVLTESSDFEVEETENTIGILNRYIDESEFEGDKTLIKGILQQIYTEACEVD